MALHSKKESSCKNDSSSLEISKNGHNFQPMRIPWHVGLSSTRGGFIFCGGSLISLNLILTAAHCIDRWPTVNFASAGHLNRKYREYRQEESHQVRHIQYEKFKHPLYKSTTLSYDLAILKTDHPFEQTSYVRPACLPARNLVLPRFSKCIVSGFGQKKDGSSPDELGAAVLRNYPRRNCNRQLASKI